MQEAKDSDQVLDSAPLNVDWFNSELQPFRKLRQELVAGFEDTRREIQVINQ